MRASRVARWVVLGSAAAAAGACGARTGLDYPPAPEVIECKVDADCPGSGDFCNPVVCRMVPLDFDGGVAEPIDAGGVLRCVTEPPYSCDDNDPCTKDTCDSALAACKYAPATLDSDGDGYRAPRPGFLPGEAEACGDDCDDTNAAAHPGGIEICDGVDNDCNGKVDDGATYVPLDSATKKITDLAPSDPGGLGWSGQSYLAIFSGTSGGNFDMLASVLSPDGTVHEPPGQQTLTLSNGTGFGGPIFWTGDRYGVTWTDRSTGDYEIYFWILNAEGGKAFPKAQLTDAFGFSIAPAIAWNGTEFIVVWQDERDGPFQIFGQRVDIQGNPVGDNVQLTQTDDGLNDEAPSLATGVKTVGIVWSHDDAFDHAIQLQLFSVDLTTPVTEPIQIDIDAPHTNVVYPTVIWNKDRYVVMWSRRDDAADPEPNPAANPRAIYGAAFAEDGTMLVAPKPLTNPGVFRSRMQAAKPLGDRMLLLWADDRDGDDYEIYSRMLDADLGPQGAELRITTAPQDSLYPIPAFGPDGDVGVLFRDRRDGQQKVYFTHLGCVTPQAP